MDKNSNINEHVYKTLNLSMLSTLVFVGYMQMKPILFIVIISIVNDYDIHNSTNVNECLKNSQKL